LPDTQALEDGNSFAAGLHQDAQNETTTTCRRQSDAFTGVPDSNVAQNHVGCCLPAAAREQGSLAMME
jgi:hypothetical protein